ncbi:hypothetical protein VTN49DRAFT_7964 [Thermomyces lanuginosus]|uniref:uncharacterized protein n=1 Tax=Thermomyces lanuginosus TaxID=5541 RepID=UPI0037426A17
MVDRHNRPRRGGHPHGPGRHHRFHSPPHPRPDRRPPPPSPSPEPQPPPQPHPSFIQVAKPYTLEHTVQECLAATASDPQREDNIRIQGVTWIDNVRKALRLPVRTYNTACVYYHKFRLVHPENQYNYLDAAAAALFTACKIEDTLKKSRDIVSAAYNLKLLPGEHLSPDDPVFDAHSRSIIILERLMLESSGFDFRNRHPQKLLIKLAKQYGVKKSDEVGLVAYGISLDLYRTFAPLKQTAAAMAFACLELASRLVQGGLTDVEEGKGYEKWNIERAEVMETLLDLLDLYIHHRNNTVCGPQFPLEAFLAIRIPLNQEAEARNLPRYTGKPPHPAAANGVNPPHNASNNPNSAAPATPVNPLTPASAIGERPAPNDNRGRDGTVRFMLDAAQAEAEKKIVSAYFKDEVEEYIVED